jgi:osmotically-inducible protein OsmY
LIGDEYLICDVADELFWDPRLGSEAIVVDAEQGVVRLSGTVASPREKLEAKKTAERVRGVVSVDNRLRVRLMENDRRDDAEIQADVGRALMLNGMVPRTVGAAVADGVVTLTGTATWQHEREEAVLVASTVVGAVDVIDEIELVHRLPRPEDVRDLIERAWKRNAALDAEGLTIVTTNGVVAIRGTVRSSVEHDQAIQAAWASPGVKSVEDHLKVVS